MKTLQKILFNLPTNNHRQIQAFNFIAFLLTASPHAQVMENAVQLGTTTEEVFPKIIFSTSKEIVPQVVFGKHSKLPLNTTTPDVKVKRSELSLEEINQKFAKHIVALDHVGINIPAVVSDHGEKDNLLYFLGSNANTYAYPEGEPWYFVLPCTQDERSKGITDFSKPRFPKFEVVLDPTYLGSTIQFDFATNLSRKEMEDLLPAPQGFTLPGLDQHFRSVYASHPWLGLEIRFDFRYKTELVNEWSTGQWIATKGTKVK